MLPLMRPAAPDTPRSARRLDGSLHEGQKVLEDPWIHLDPTRPLIIGVIPHTQCNPRVEGCGFCTFPHDPFDKATLSATARSTTEEIESLCAAHPELGKRHVDAVYFGGGTANLTPASSLRGLAGALARCFDLSQAEVTLEGVPSLFRSLLAGPFEVLADMPARHRRISIGVQTFDDVQLARMGRQSFGDRRVVAKVIDKAHHGSMTVSGDFLINLPGETLESMLDDVRTAAALGFDQICVYHLVLTGDMALPWARDPSILSSLPSVSEACEHWLAIRELLVGSGFVQTTLTNFERAELRASDKRFAYEECSFTPERYDALGFGPLSISTFVDSAQRRAVKLVRGKDRLRCSDAWRAGDLHFPYEEQDLRLLHVTRTLARLWIDRGAYRALLGADLVDHFGEVVEALLQEGLVTIDDVSMRLTPRGMFFGDSVSGLFAWRRAEALRPQGAGKRTADLLGTRTMVDFMG